MTDISVILPVYNAGTPLALAIDSILRQTRDDFEFLIIDDGSTDQSRELILDRARLDSRIRPILHAVNQGLANTLNEGLQRAAGKYVVRIDQDDEALPERIETQAAFLDERPDVAAAGSFVYHMGARPRFDRLITLPTEHERIARALTRINCIYHPSVIMRRETILALGGYRGEFRNAEDYDLWLRVSKQHRLANIARPLLRYRFSVSGMSLRKKWEQYSYMRLAQISSERPEANLKGLLLEAEDIIDSEGRRPFMKAVYAGTIRELIALRHWGDALKLGAASREELGLASAAANLSRVASSWLLRRAASAPPLVELPAETPAPEPPPEAKTEPRLPVEAPRRSVAKKALRRAFRVRDYERFFPHAMWAPRRYLTACRRRLVRALPKTLKAQLRRQFRIADHESLLFHFWKVIRRNRMHRAASEPIVNQSWPADRPMVSVIIPCFNYGQYVKEAIGSVLESTWRDLEILLVEGGSTDGTTPQVIRELEGGPVRCFYQPRRASESENRLLGLNHARGKYILFLDADDLVDPTYIETAVYLMETTGVDVICPDIRFFSSPDDLLRALGSRQGEVFVTRGIPVPEIFQSNMTTVASMFRHSFWRDHNLGVCELDRFGQDWWLWMRFASHGARYLHLPEPHHLYRTHPASISSLIDEPAKEASRVVVQRRFAKICNDPRQIEAAAIRQAIAPPLENPLINLQGGRPAAPSRGGINILLSVPWFDQGGSNVLLGSILNELSKKGTSVTVAATNPETGLLFANGAANFLSFTKDCFTLQTCTAGKDRTDFLSYLVRARAINVLLLAGSRLTYEALARLRRENPSLRVIDHLYNTEGHVGSNREFAADIDFNIVANNDVRDELLRRGENPARIEVIPHGVDLRDFQPSSTEQADGSKPRPFTFGFLGRLSEEKRPDYVVDLARRLPEYRFIIAGDGPMRGQIANDIVNEDLADRIRLVGFVSAPRELYDAVDAILIPSRIEGLPIVLLEAMALGKTVIASRVGMIGQVIEEGRNGFTVAAGNRDELARTLRHVAQLPASEREQIGRRARHTVERSHSLERCAARYLELFARLTKVDGTPLASKANERLASAA